MTEVRFYHLQRTTLERALPELLEKCLGRGWRAVVLTASAERCEALTQQLWTYGDSSFLPHGNAKDGEAARQPIWLTDSDENPNGASVLFLTGGMETADPGAYDLVCDLFDGNDGEAVAAARRRWKAVREAGHALAYWQQSEQGRWEQKQRVEATV
ncbi:MAG: DNA polymerase III subunit chi [Deinococcus-Thermus bacterium]|jgi:DNA polymerase-3 subunit chi|nr:DNA polymerase III subunit chi [Deinococcota bacterium]